MVESRSRLVGFLVAAEAMGAEIRVCDASDLNLRLEDGGVATSGPLLVLRAGDGTDVAGLLRRLHEVHPRALSSRGGVGEELIDTPHGMHLTEPLRQLLRQAQKHAVSAAEPEIRKKPGRSYPREETPRSTRRRRHR